MKTIVIHWPSLTSLGIAAILLGCLIIFRKYHLLKRKRPPFAKNLLRSPGHSLVQRLDQINQEINISLFSLLSVPLFICAVYISQLYFAQKQITTVGIVTIVFLCSTSMFYFLFNFSRCVRQKRAARMAYDGHVAVAQELNQLMLEGYHVYHDFPADEFNIDHVVVGHTGVFTVKTLARSMPKSGDRMEDATVTYDGRILYFPKGDDWKTIDLAKHQASWLSNWIHHVVGEPLAVRAVVTLPGWYVKRTSAEGIPVINPQQLPSLFTYIKPRHLSEEMITRIANQIEQKCRDGEPDSPF